MPGRSECARCCSSGPRCWAPASWPPRRRGAWPPPRPPSPPRPWARGSLTALGFPYFARFVPEGEAGRYSGLFFAGRAVAAGAALPLAGLAVELSGSYRAVLWLGAASLVALVPLLLAERGPLRARPHVADPARPARVAA